MTKGAWGSLFILFVVKVLQGLAGIGFAFFLRSVIDAAAGGDNALFHASLRAGCAIIAAEIVFYWLAIYYKEKPAAQLVKDIRSKIFSELLTRSYRDISRVHTGEWMVRLNNDVTVISNALAAIVPGTAGLIVQMFCTFGAMFVVLPRMAWILIPLGIAMILLSLILRLRLKEYHKEVQRYEGLSTSFLQESLGSMPIIRTYTREDQTTKEAEKRLDDIVDVRLRRARFTSFCASSVYALMRLSYFLGVAICGIRLLQGVLSYGMMAAVLQLIRQADAPLAEVTLAAPQFFNMIGSAERLMEIQKLESDYAGDAVSPAEARRRYENDLLSIGFDGVDFSYHSSGNIKDPVAESFTGGRPRSSGQVLKNLCLEIKKGDYVAFTGESGCGKSTTMNLLMGLYTPDKGRLFIRFLDDKDRDAQIAGNHEISAGKEPDSSADSAEAVPYCNASITETGPQSNADSAKAVPYCSANITETVPQSNADAAKTGPQSNTDAAKAVLHTGTDNAGASTACAGPDNAFKAGIPSGKDNPAVTESLDGEHILDARWRALFAYVPQENLLMSGRIRDVVAFADAAAAGRDEKIWEALRIACAESFVRALPHGLDTVLGERGAGLSEGQMQRLAIARALFSRRPVLMLDESTSALDEKTEWQLLKNLQNMTDRTVVIITHRPAALRICTKQIHFSKTPA